MRNPGTRWTWTAGTGVVLALSALTAGCDDGGSNLVVTSPPALSLQVDKVAANDAKKDTTCFNFKPDTTRGQIKQHKEVLIRNSGALVGKTIDPLCVKYTWDSDNSQLKLGTVSGKVTDPKCKPGELAVTAPAGALKFDLTYAPNPDLVETTTASLTIETNDAKNPKRKLCFGIGLAGAIVELDQTSYCFENAKESTPPSQCFTFGNAGSKEVCYFGYDFDPANAQYTVVKQPNQGDCIPALGEGDNLPTKKKKLEVCVRFTPNKTEGDDEVKLAIKTQTGGQPPESHYIQLCHKSTPSSTYTVKCDNTNPDQIGYDFKGVQGGSKERCCTVQNEGPNALLFQNCEIVSLNPGPNDAILTQVYKAVLKVFDVPTGDYIEAKSLPYSVAKTKSAKVCLTYSPQPATKAPGAYLRCNVNQDNQTGTLTFPIETTACDTPIAAFAPPTPWAQAGVGKSAKTHVLVGNQSCAPLTLVNACIAAASFKGDPCTKPSDYFKFPNGFAPITVPAWGVHALEVEFAPKNDNKLTVDDVMHLSWCVGSWANGQCNGDLITQGLNLQGSVEEANTPATLTCPQDLTGTVGKPVKVACQVTAGKFQQIDNFGWGVRKRPDGSQTWIAGDQQQTASPEVTFVPDLAGDYEILGMAQSINADNPIEYTWSLQVVAKVKVTK